MEFLDQLRQMFIKEAWSHSTSCLKDTRDFYRGGKRPELEADSLPQSFAWVKMNGAMPPFPNPYSRSCAELNLWNFYVFEF